MAEPLDVVRRAVLELIAIVKNHVTEPEEVARCTKVSAEVRGLEALNHAADNDGSGHCIHCGHAITVSTVHIWPLRY